MVLTQWLFPEWLQPVAFHIGAWPIRWYGLAYALGFMVAWYGLRWRIHEADAQGRQAPFSEQQLDEWITYAVLGVIIGGRLGYMLIYAPHLSLGWHWLALWRGGMSFHGGLGGVVVATWWFAKREHCDAIACCDWVVPWVPVGLGLGRLANFANGELWGRPTDQSWGMLYPWVDGLWRHPSQLYEACLEGCMLGLFLQMAFRHRCHKRGWLSGAFLLGYGIVRFTVEFVREPDHQLGLLAWGLSMGQWLSVPLVVMGGAMVYHATLKRR